MKRITAIVAAATMIVVSLFIRSRLDDEDGGRTKGAGEPVVVACVTELQDACRAAFGDSVVLRIEDAHTTASALAKGKKEIDDWVTMAGWPELLAVKGIDPPLAVTRVASTPLVIAAVKERAAALTCAAKGWSCFLDAAGKQWSDLGGKAEWGTVQVGLPPAASASGLLLEASAITGYAGTADVGTNDAAYGDARAALGRVDRKEPDAFNAFIVQLPARFSVVGALQADVSAHQGSKADQIATFGLTPATTATAVVARLGNGRHIDTDKLVAALETTGWSKPPADATGLPDAGVLLALSGL